MALRQFWSRWDGVGAAVAGALTLLVVTPATALALPGQPARVVSAWIQNNPTLGARPNDRLTVTRGDNPARRLTFQASPLPVAGGVGAEGGGIIRTERLTLHNAVDGITADRLEEAVRILYGPGVHTDYRQGEVVYVYPLTGLPAPQQGQVRQGQRFAYWLELTADPQGRVITGQVVLFLPADLPSLLRRLEAKQF